MTGQSVATAPRPNPDSWGWPGRLLPPSLAPDDRAMFRDFAVLGSALFAVTFIAYAWTIDWRGTIPRDGTTLAVGRDFLNFWMYGRAAVSADPGRFYDLAAYQQAIRDLLGMELNGQNWSYPPSVMWLAAPFGQLNYLAALACWTLTGVAVFVAAARNYAPDWRVLIPVALSPAALFCLISGQSAFLTAAVMMAIFALLDCRPLVAGVLIGFLTVKPQLGILFPFMLIASGRWRVFFAAAVTTLALVAVTAASFGPQVWIDFVAKGLPVQGLVLSDPDRIATPFYPTIFMNLRGLDLSPAAAMAVQSVFSAGAAGAGRGLGVQVSKTRRSASDVGAVSRLLRRRLALPFGLRPAAADLCRGGAARHLIARCARPSPGAARLLDPGPAAGARDLAPAGSGAGRPHLRGLSLDQAARLPSAGPGLKRDTIFQGQWFSEA